MEELDGIGFKTADQIAQKIGIPVDSLVRAAPDRVTFCERFYHEPHKQSSASDRVWINSRPRGAVPTNKKPLWRERGGSQRDGSGAEALQRADENGFELRSTKRLGTVNTGHFKNRQILIRGLKPPGAFGCPTDTGRRFPAICLRLTFVAGQDGGRVSRGVIQRPG